MQGRKFPQSIAHVELSQQFIEKLDFIILSTNSLMLLIPAYIGFYNYRLNLNFGSFHQIARLIQLYTILIQTLIIRQVLLCSLSYLS